jgi:hypothetical protein
MSFYQKFLAKKMKESKNGNGSSLKRNATVRSDSRKSSLRPKKSKTMTPKIAQDIEQRIKLNKGKL